MPELHGRVSKKVGSTAPFAERFPSLHKWKIPWEKIVDLQSLRANAGKLRSMELLFDQQYADRHDLLPERKGLMINCEALDDTADALVISEDLRSQLIEDSRLIAAWYLLPARQSALGPTRSDNLVALSKISKAAKTIFETIDRNLYNLRQFEYDIADHEDDSLEGFDLINFGMISGSLATIAEGAIKQAKAPHGGRKKDARRNYALALIVAATEEATGKKVTSTRGPDSDPQKRFTDAAGQYVAEFFRSVGLKDEQVLVGAFEKISRTSRSSGK